MEWVQRGSLLRQEDMNVLKFIPKESCVFRGLKWSDEIASSISRNLVSDQDWNEWLDENQTDFLDGHQSGITLLFGGRNRRRIPGTEVSYLPFSRDICPRVVEAFGIHRSISRVISRNTTATFSALTTNDPYTNHPTLVYNCKSSSAWPNDLALSVSYSPYRKDTRAVLYGCYESSRDKFIDRLSNWSFVAYHPLLLPTIFAEIERERHFDILSPIICELVNRVEVLGVADADADAVVSDESSEEAETSEHYIKLWLKISWLKNGLQNWKEQLEKMISHCDELRQAKFHISNQGFDGSNISTPINTKLRVDIEFNKEDPAHAISDTLSGLEDSGTLIRQRLLELRGEYDDKIRTCATIIDGMALAAQLEWNKIGREDTKTNLAISSSNLDIAKAAKIDGERMRSIAFLTMIFLPATFVATFFSMTFFEWNPAQGQAIVSPYIWIYIIGTVMLTSLTMAMWYFFSRRKRRGNSKVDPEMQETE
ncbi:hypothetical protein F4810DRAFT_449577 [Camillea tinctor]|nr:hypothetical protein F4810DRAFT_449577 [Camillea tinctor]